MEVEREVVLPVKRDEEWSTLTEPVAEWSSALELRALAYAYA